MKRWLILLGSPLLIASLALLWNLSGLLQAPGYISLRLFGWQLDTTAVYLLLGLSLLLPVLLLLRLLVRAAAGSTRWLNRRGKSRQTMTLISATVLGDWPKVARALRQIAEQPEQPEPSSAEGVALALVQAYQQIYSGQAGEAERQLAELEAAPALLPAARFVRIKALQQLGRAEEALMLMHQLPRAPTSAFWRLTELELLVQRRQWDEIQRLLATAASADLPQREVERLRYQNWLKLIQSARTPAKAAQCWEKLQPWPESDEASQLLEATVEQMCQLPPPSKAVALLLKELGGEYREAAVGLCRLVPPGAHCRPLLKKLAQMHAQQPEDPSLQLAHHWLTFCCKEPSDADSRPQQAAE